MAPYILIHNSTWQCSTTSRSISVQASSRFSTCYCAVPGEPLAAPIYSILSGARHIRAVTGRWTTLSCACVKSLGYGEKLLRRYGASAIGCVLKGSDHALTLLFIQNLSGTRHTRIAFCWSDMLVHLAALPAPPCFFSMAHRYKSLYWCACCMLVRLALAPSRRLPATAES